MIDTSDLKLLISFTLFPSRSHHVQLVYTLTNTNCFILYNKLCYKECIYLFCSLPQSTATCPRFATDKAEAYSAFEQWNAANISTLLKYFNSFPNETYDADDLSYIFEKIFAEVSVSFLLL